MDAIYLKNLIYKDNNEYNLYKLKLFIKILFSINLYVEIKGYKTERDIAKWLWFPHPLAVVEKDGIKKIRKKQYTLELLELSRVILSGVL